MKGSTVALLVLGVAGAGGAVWYLTHRQQPSSAAGAMALASKASSGGSSSGVLLKAESAVAAATHVPLGAIGSAASRAPTLLKVAAFPIGATAVAQQVINHPVQSAKAVVSAPVSAAKSVISGIRSLF